MKIIYEPGEMLDVRPPVVGKLECADYLLATWGALRRLAREMKSFG
ncbi:MAG TPA: hypothetical protein VGW32_07085 [Pyrinomonadaceae bacterium]|nr:hypothetical protein [Pyrinomonadaceae bacterium]